MIGFGQMLDMVIKTRNNEALLNKRKHNPFNKEENTQYYDTSLKYKVGTNEEIQIIKEKIKKEKLKDNLKIISFSILIVLLLGFCGYYLYNFLF